MFEQLQGMMSGTGAIGAGELTALQKALTMGYTSNPADMSGGRALAVQSLDATMKATIQQNEHFVLFNQLAKPGAGGTVDEWTEQSGIGGFLGGSTNSETGDIQDATGEYQRRVALVKFLMTRREVSYVATLGKNIAQAEAVENMNGALQLLSDAEYLCFEGDSAVVPTEFDGIESQVASLNDSSHLIDLEGESLVSIGAVTKAAAEVAGFGNFGRITDLYMSQLNQSDFDANLDPAWRVSLNNVAGGGVQIGSPVVGIRTSWGNITPRPDVFIRDEQFKTPFELRYGAVASRNNFAPAAVAAAASASGGAGSKWKAAQAGQFYYLVAGVNAKGQSVGALSAQVAVVAGGKITLEITKSVSGEETGYVIYRSRKNGSSALSDLREQCRIPRASSGNTTTWEDLNVHIPGTTKAYGLSMGPNADAINWRQLLPMTKFPLYPTKAATIPWAQLLFGYLRLAKRRQHVVFHNIVNPAQVWKPFA